jgi:hypothetical protein
MSAPKLHGCGEELSRHLYDRGYLICPEQLPECTDCGPSTYCLACSDDRAYTIWKDEK